MTPLPLPPRLDLSQVGALTNAIRARAGAGLVLDAGEVTHLGGLGLQVLLSAAQSWRAAGQSLSINPRSEAFDEALTLFGVGLDAVQSQEAA
ncbi:MAG: STAS domain-containing protein [Sphingomonadales bacterium]|nr:STAS domain-containing protein [Sphingomonadales bacterium]